MNEAFSTSSYRDVDRYTFEKYREHKIGNIEALRRRVNNGLTSFVLSIWEESTSSPIDDNPRFRRPRYLASEVMISEVAENNNTWFVSVSEHFRGIYHIDENPFKVTLNKSTFVNRPLDAVQNSAFFAPTASEIQRTIRDEALLGKEITQNII